MDEPTLETIGDYNELKGEKKKFVWGVIVVGLIIGVLYIVIANKYSEVDDSIKVQESVKNIPIK